MQVAPNTALQSAWSRAFQSGSGTVPVFNSGVSAGGFLQLKAPSFERRV